MDCTGFLTEACGNDGALCEELESPLEYAGPSRAPGPGPGQPAAWQAFFEAFVNARIGFGAFGPSRPVATILQNTHGTIRPVRFSASRAAACASSSARYR